MNILYIGFFSLPDKDAAANRVLNNAKAFRMCGHNVILVDEQTDYQYENFQNSKHNVQGFDSWSLKRPKGVMSCLGKMFDCVAVKYLLNYYDSIDLIIAYNYPAIALEKIRRICRNREIMIAADCTEWYSGKEYNFPLNILCALDSFVRMNIIHKRLDGIISISSFLDSYYKNYNSIFIPPLVDLSEEKWNCTVKKLNSNLNLVYSGNPGKNKENLLPIIEAINLSSNKGILLKIVGLSKEHFLDLYLGSDLILDENIQFLGRISHSDNLKVVKASDFLVFFRDKTRVNQAGFSTKFVEAISLGTAVVTTDTGDLKEYIHKYKCGIIIKNKNDLVQILNSDMNSLKKYSKDAMQSSTIFDYHNYTSKIACWIGSMKKRRN